MTTSTAAAPDLEAQAKDPTNLGNVLLRLGVAEQADVDVAMQAKQAAAWKELPLGEVMVALGLVEQDDVAYGLQVQEAMRAGKFGSAAVLIMRHQTQRMDKSIRRVLPTATATLRSLGVPDDVLQELQTVA